MVVVLSFILSVFFFILSCESSYFVSHRRNINWVTTVSYSAIRSNYFLDFTGIHFIILAQRASIVCMLLLLSFSFDAKINFIF